MKILYRISSRDKKILIPQCDGTRRICRGKLFHFVSDDVKKYVGRTNTKTPETEVEVFQLNPLDDIRDRYEQPLMYVSCSEVFPALGRETKSMMLTQHQVLEFCRLHKNWLEKGKEIGSCFGTSFTGETVFLLTKGEFLMVSYGRDFDDNISLEANCYGSGLDVRACTGPARVVIRR